MLDADFGPDGINIFLVGTLHEAPYKKNSANSNLIIRAYRFFS